MKANVSQQLLLCALTALTCLAMACGGGGGGSEPPSGTSNGSGCPAGDLGCECLPDNTCNVGSGDQMLMCISGICAPAQGGTSNGTTGTSNGTTGVGDAGNMDDTGQDGDVGAMDTGDTSTMPDVPEVNGFTGMGLAVEQAEARACEAVVLDPELRIEQVQFDDTIDGQDYRRGERLAIAFNARENSPLAEGAVSFVLKDGVNDLDGVQLMVARCFSGDGLSMGEATLTIIDKR